MDWLNRKDFIEITGFQTPKKICQKLREQGIRFTIRADGWPSLTPEAYNLQVCNMGKQEKIESDGFEIDNA